LIWLLKAMVVSGALALKDPAMRPERIPACTNRILKICYDKCEDSTWETDEKKHINLTSIE